MKTKRVVLKRVLVTLAVFAMSFTVYFANFAAVAAKAESTTPVANKDYYIDWLVPNEIALVRATSFTQPFGLWCSSVVTYLGEGVREVGRQYIIKSETPLTERWGNANPTVALLLHVEWRPVEDKPKYPCK